MNADVLILGAGAAGLAAAERLSRAGKSVVMIEARDRIGGRVHTERGTTFHQPIELGAEFIHGRPAQTWEIIKSAGLSTVEGCDEHWLLKGGKLRKAPHFWDDLETVLSKLPQAKAGESFDDFAARCCREGRAHEMLGWARIYVEGFEAADAGWISAKSLAESQESSEEIDGNKIFRLTSGYDRLIQAIHERLEAARVTIHLKTPAHTVRWAGERVEVLFCDHKKFQANQALITLPLGVLQAPAGSPGAVSFRPAIAEKLQAAGRLAMGDVVKVVLQFDGAFWKGQPFATLEDRADGKSLCFMHGLDIPFATWWTLRPVEAPILVGWSGGPQATMLSQRADSDTLAVALNCLARMTGLGLEVIRSHLMTSRVANWPADPYARGAYTYIPVGGEGAMEELAAPIGNRLYFAGEATDHTGLSGTVAGAIASGYRAASEILKAG